MINLEEFKKFKILKGLNSDEIDILLSCSNEISIQDGNIIFEESSISSDIFIIVEGRVSVDVGVSHFYDDKKDKKQLAVLRKGNVFGEIAFLERGRRSAYVTAIGEVKLIQLDAEKLYKLFDKNNHLGYLFTRNLAIVLAERLIDLTLMCRSYI
ncbi:Cyclic nucleotide-binding domain-containing protein [Candidatus Magnetomoraceae bacterium gMMP-15]